MRNLMILAAAALTLAACNRNEADSADANALSAEDNMLMADNGLTADDGAGGADANADTNAAVEEAKKADLNTNDADTNLANGL